ncbi:MAG TPA: hypothetical protein PK295_04180 [Candidatus Magasanikbacteria bacterium]|nr:hypothetical protein [Candidatus Magasanikbacteria bacterium]
MKKIALFTNMPLSKEGRPAFKPTYWTSYSELSQAVSAYGGQLYITHGQQTYIGNGSFSRSWIIADNILQDTGPIVAEVIFDKGKFKSDETVPVFNHPELSNICNDKWLMYQMFPEYCPTTFFAKSKEELHSTLPHISTQKIVFKPFLGAEGRGIKIEDKQYFLHHSEALIYPGVVSDFLDTSNGIPGIVEGTHDLRLTIFDGEILYSYFRTPPVGSLLANVSKGGRFEMVDIQKLPSDIVTIAKQVDSRFMNLTHRFYCIDFGYTPKGPKIIEMNSEVGLLPNKDGKVFAKLKEKLAQVFMDL